MKAALEGRQDTSLVIAARTSAFSITDNDDAIARAKAYEVAGVDALFFTGIDTKEQVELINAAVSIPVFIAPGGKEVVDLPYLAKHGVRICLQGHKPFTAAVQATYTTLKALRDGVPSSEIENVASGELMKQLTRNDNYQRLMKEYL